MGKTKKDAYEMWCSTGKWPEIRNFLINASWQLMTQREICRRLNVHETAFSRLKTKHPEIQEALYEGKLNLKVQCLNNIKILADGYDEVTEDKIVSDGGEGKKQTRKIHQTTRHVAPDFKANVYLLTRHFGAEFEQNSEQLKLMREKIESSKEEWSNGEESSEDSNDES